MKAKGLNILIKSYRYIKTAVLFALLAIIIVIRGRDFNIGKIYKKSVRSVQERIREKRLGR